jgi:hypothetical protein
MNRDSKNCQRIYFYKFISWCPECRGVGRAFEFNTYEYVGVLTTECTPIHWRYISLISCMYCIIL